MHLSYTTPGIAALIVYHTNGDFPMDQVCFPLFISEENVKLLGNGLKAAQRLLIENTDELLRLVVLTANQKVIKRNMVPWQVVGPDG